MDISWLSLLRLAVQAGAAGFILFIAWRDFYTFRIRNMSVLILIALSASISALSGFEGLAGQLAAGAVLFALGVAFWAAGLAGAGDAKLLLPVGLLLGWENLASFTIALLTLSVLAFALVKLPVARGNSRLGSIRVGGLFPYGAVIGPAAVIAMILQEVRP